MLAAGMLGNSKFFTARATAFRNSEPRMGHESTRMKRGESGKQEVRKPFHPLPEIPPFLIQKEIRKIRPIRGASTSPNIRVIREFVVFKIQVGWLPR